MGTYPYDEFGLFHENVAEWQLAVAIPRIERFFVSVDGLRQLSGLRWGDGDADMVLLHGIAQNAHTFDTVALALQRPLIALDLANHGHSDPFAFAHGAVRAHADDVIVALEALTTKPIALVGMSLGGLVALVVASERPDLISSLTMIDVTPGVHRDRAKYIMDFVNGPASFDDFEALLARTKAHNPSRSESSLRRGILHNALQRDDGSWVWRHQRHQRSEVVAPDAGDLWERCDSLTMPVTLVRAMGPGSVVTDDDEALMRARVPQLRVVPVEHAGHSVQGDQPVVLADILASYSI